MEYRHGLVFVLAASFAVAPAVAQNAAPLQPPAAGGTQLMEFKPGFDDVMTMMVQPRHIKLHAAAEAKNWELAAFQLRELRASFRRIGQYLPKYRGTGLDEAVKNMMGPTLDGVDSAIKAKDPKAFTTAYAGLTDACNACHVATDHAFLVIKVPDLSAAPYPDQEFKTPQ